MPAGPVGVVADGFTAKPGPLAITDSHGDATEDFTAASTGNWRAAPVSVVIFPGCRCYGRTAQTAPLAPISLKRSP
jgi:hypothetical protein